MKILMKRTAIAAFAALALLAAVSFPHSTRALIGPANGGEELFKAKCASCHGADGKGNTPAGQQLKAHDLRSGEVQKLSDAQLAAAIAKGKGKMPPFEQSLNKEQINGLVAYVRGLGKK